MMKMGRRGFVGGLTATIAGLLGCRGAVAKPEGSLRKSVGLHCPETNEMVTMPSGAMMLLLNFSPDDLAIHDIYGARVAVLKSCHGFTLKPIPAA